MDVSGIDLKYIKAFDLNYTAAEDMLNKPPENAPPKEQRKIRKRLIAFEDREQEYPPEVTAFVGEDVSDKDYFDFLKACHDFTEKYDADKKQRFYDCAADLTDKAKSALWDILCAGGCADFKKIGANAEITFNYLSSYTRTLILYNPSGLPAQADFLNFTDGSFEKREGKYILSGEAFNFDEDKYFPFSVSFTDAEERVDVFRADEHSFTVTPWDYLQSIADGIISKNELSDEYLNERERVLLPLLYDIS
ncbi:MAG: hypothetical protein ACI4F7_09130, partial [Acutalibacteraceae bacterium]